MSNVSILSDFRNLFVDQNPRLGDDGWDAIDTVPNAPPIREVKQAAKPAAPLPPLFHKPPRHDGTYTPAYRPPTYAELVRTSPQIGLPSPVGNPAPIRGNEHPVTHEPTHDNLPVAVRPKPAKRGKPWKSITVAIFSGLLVGGGVLAATLLFGQQTPEPSIISMDPDTEVPITVIVAPEADEVEEKAEVVAEEKAEVEQADETAATKPRKVVSKNKRAKRRTKRFKRKRKRRRSRVAVDDILAAGARGSAGAQADDDDDSSEADDIALMNSVN